MTLHSIFFNCFLFGTAFLAGGLNAVAGGGSFISFPALLFAGVPAIAANATNNTAMWVAAMASAGAYRQDLDIDRRSIILLSIASIVGGILGAIALLHTEPEIFNRLIPYLLLLATLVFAFGEPFKAWLQGKSQHDPAVSAAPPLQYLLLAQFAIAIYGGFFGAGMGILMLATLTFLGVKNIHTMNAFKTYLGSCINGVAIVPFAIAGAIAWYEAILMAVGGSLGGYITARYARQVQPQLIRQVVTVVASCMTAYFFLRGS